MYENIKAIIENYTLNAFQVAIISAVVSFLTFLFTIIIKNYFENKLHKRKLETEHKFNQQKKIKEVLAKYKGHLLSACDDFSQRMWRYYPMVEKDWLKISKKQSTYTEKGKNYYMHSFIYRYLSVLAWIKIIEKKLIFIDTTLSSKNDLEFIKFLRVISLLFCELKFSDEVSGTDKYERSHIYRNNLNVLPDTIITKNEIKSYSEYLEKVYENLQEPLLRLYEWFDDISPFEDRRRWDRFYLFHLIVIIFLNNYGYDFQKTDKIKIKQLLDNSHKEVDMNIFFDFLKDYLLDNNKEVNVLQKLWQKTKINPLYHKENETQ